MEHKKEKSWFTEKETTTISSSAVAAIMAAGAVAIVGALHVAVGGTSGSNPGLKWKGSDKKF